MHRVPSGTLALLVLVSLCLGVSPAAAARRISSDPNRPDTTRATAAALARAAEVSLPVWFGVEYDKALARTKWDRNRREGSASRVRFSIRVPSTREHWSHWTSVEYEQGQVRVPMYVVAYTDSLWEPVFVRTHSNASTSLFTLRAGLERGFGNDARPRVFLGFGTGVGYGLRRSPWAGPAEDVWSVGAVAQAGAYVYTNRHNRIGLHALGAMDFRRTSSRDATALSEWRLGLSFQPQLSAPARHLASP